MFLARIPDTTKRRFRFNECGVQSFRCEISGSAAADQTFTLGFLTGQLAGAAHGLCLLASLLFRRLLVKIAQLHLAENTFTLKLLLESAQRLIDIVIANDYLQRSTALSNLQNFRIIGSSETPVKGIILRRTGINRLRWAGEYQKNGAMSTGKAPK